MMKNRSEKTNADTQSRVMPEPSGSGERGSIMVIVLIVLVLLTLAGISATNMSVTESFIVRNTAIQKQNLQLAEMAAMEGLREILTRNNAWELAPGAEVWLRDISLWNNDPTVDDPTNDNNFPLTDNNSVAAAAALLDDRGETDEDPLRYYFVGWRGAPLNSIVMTGPMWRQGRVIAVYDSEDYGLASVEVGVVKRF